MLPTETLEESDRETKPGLLTKCKTEEQGANGDTLTVPPKETSPSVHGNDRRETMNELDEEVDILDFGGGGGGGAEGPVKAEDLDMTEQSSSFGDTLSGLYSELNLDTSDGEVESPFGRSNGGDATAFDAPPRLFKKKKVTAHWRKFIGPLMWRCQWLELRIKELHSQASKYDKELAMLKHEKDLHAKMIELDSSCSRAVPFSPRCRTKKAMKRRNRRRLEDTADRLSYISDHIIFSYTESKRSETDGHSVDDDSSDQVDETMKGTEETDWLVGTRAGDSSLEQVLLKIDSLQSRIGQLRTNLTKALGKKSLRKPSPLLGTGNVHTSSYAAAHRDYDVADDDVAEPVLPGSVVSSYGDVADVGGMETNSRCPFSAADIASHQIHGLYKDNADDVLIDNQVAEEQYQNFEKVSHPRDSNNNIIKRKEEEVEIKIELAPALSEEESTAPKIVPSLNNQEREGQGRGQKKKRPSTQETAVTLKPLYTGKRRGRKPKRRRRVGSVSAPSTSALRKVKG